LACVGAGGPPDAHSGRLERAFSQEIGLCSRVRWDCVFLAGTAGEEDGTAVGVAFDRAAQRQTSGLFPEETIDAFLDHGTVARTVDADPAAAGATLAALAAVGVDLDVVGEVLEEQGVAAFAKSFDELIGALDAKAAELGAS
jgi:hypothetical protein